MKKVKINFFGKLFSFAATNIIATCFIVAVLAVALGTVVFYRYNIMAQKVEFKSYDYLKLEEKTYNQILAVWAVEEEKSKQSESKNYYNPFREITPK